MEEVLSCTCIFEDTGSVQATFVSRKSNISDLKAYVLKHFNKPMKLKILYDIWEGEKFQSPLSPVKDGLIYRMIPKCITDVHTFCNCDDEGDKEAVGYCVTDYMYFCTDCKEKHQSHESYVVINEE